MFADFVFEKTRVNRVARKKEGSRNLATTFWRQPIKKKIFENLNKDKIMVNSH